MTKEERLLGELKDFYRWSEKRPMRSETLTEEILRDDMAYEFGVRSKRGMSLSNHMPFEIGPAIGSFDTHFVILLTCTRDKQLLTAKPTDTQMLRALKTLADILKQPDDIWEDMLEIADVVHAEKIDITDVITPNAIRRVSRAAIGRMQGYSPDAASAIEGLYHYCLQAMIAEEHRYLGRKGYTNRTKLGRRIKLAAMFQVLECKMDPEAAANWSKQEDIKKDEIDSVIINDAQVDVPLIIEGWRTMSHRDSHELFDHFRKKDRDGRGEILPGQLTRLEKAQALSVRPDKTKDGCAWWIRNSLTSYSPELKARMAAERRKWRH